VYQLLKLCDFSEQNFADRHFVKTCLWGATSNKNFYLELYCFNWWFV